MIFYTYLWRHTSARSFVFLKELNLALIAFRAIKSRMEKGSCMDEVAIHFEKQQTFGAGTIDNTAAFFEIIDELSNTNLKGQFSSPNSLPKHEAEFMEKLKLVNWDVYSDLRKSGLSHEVAIFDAASRAPTLTFMEFLQSRKKSFVN